MLRSEISARESPFWAYSTFISHRDITEDCVTSLLQVHYLILTPNAKRRSVEPLGLLRRPRMRRDSGGEGGPAGGGGRDGEGGLLSKCCCCYTPRYQPTC